MDKRRASTPVFWGFVIGMSGLYAHADEVTICSGHSEVRRISLDEHERGCEATYSRQQPGTTRTLWSSHSNRNSCTQPAMSVKSKLQAAGYDCRDFFSLSSGHEHAATASELALLRRLPGYKGLESASVAAVNLTLGPRNRAGWLYIHDTGSNCGDNPAQTCSRALVVPPDSATDLPELAVDVAGGELYVGGKKNDDWVEIIHVWKGPCGTSAGAPQKVEVTLWQHSGQWFLPGKPVWVPSCETAQ